MGICESKTANQAKPKPENNTEQIPFDANNQIKKKEIKIDVNIPVPFDVIYKAIKSLCKIVIKHNGKTYFATGFFMKVSDTKKYLITNNHVISQNKINWDIEIEIHNHKKMNLNFNDRDVQFFPGVKDIAMVEIKNNDSIYNDDIEFLDYDLNYIRGYIYYENENIIIIQHPLGKNDFSSGGKIVDIYDNKFEHNITTYEGSSGSPIILYTENAKSIKVIGIHKEGNSGKGVNKGTFIGEIFKNKNNGGNIKSNNNYIIAEIYIKDEDVNKEIQIINSYDYFQRKLNFKIEKDCMNEEEITKCEIRINEKLIQFT